MKQSLAIAYAMKRKAQKRDEHEGEMAHGGMCAAHGMYACKYCHGGMMAEGGMIEREEKESGYEAMPMEHEKYNPLAHEEDDRMLNQHGEYEEGAEGMMDDNEHHAEHMDEHAVENQDFPSEEDDLVGRIMKQRQQHYSEGGRVANKTTPSSEFEDNQFDDLVKRDDLEEHYTGANSGDELGNAQEDHDRDDMVARIMASWRKKDRLPHPM